jgi:hypothetical protein
MLPRGGPLELESTFSVHVHLYTFTYIYQQLEGYRHDGIYFFGTTRWSN